MKKSRFGDEQNVSNLSSVTGGTSVREVCQSHGVSENTFYTWKRKYAGMESDERQRRCVHEGVDFGHLAPQYGLSDASFLAAQSLSWNQYQTDLSPLEGATFR